MNEQEEKSRRYDSSVDDGKIMRQQLDKVLGVVGNLDDRIADVMSSLQGDKLGNKGIIPSIEEIRERQIVFETDLNQIKMEIKEIKFSEKLKSRYQKAIAALIGAAGMGVLQVLLKHYFP